MRQAFASLLLLISLQAFAQELPLKTIEMEWEPIENAYGYEVRLTPKAGGQPLMYRVLEPKLVQDVPIGVYVVRIRSRHKEYADIWSPWSDPMLVEVLIKDLLPLEPEDKSVITAKSDSREEIEFKWSHIEKARDYVLKLWTEETKEKPLTFVTRKNSQRLRLLPGRVYFWQVTFESATQVSYVQEVKTFSFQLQGKKLIQPSIRPVKPSTEVKELTWIGSPKAKEYKVKMSYGHLDDQAAIALKEEVVKETKFPTGKLKPGIYEFEVTAQAPGHASSDKATYKVAIKPTLAELEQALR